ncbi:MAG: hypothetical protein GXP63_04935 [DPANN group archaeon]|nr:hypothetical protein [DPANN group archaeon]
MIARWTNSFVRLMGGHGIFRFDRNGVLRVAGVEALMLPMTSFAMQQFLLNKYLDRHIVQDIFYHTGKIQGKVAVRILRDKFGIKDPKRIFSMIMEQYKMVGMGRNEILKLDRKNHIVLLKKVVAPYEEKYLKLFGTQKEPVSQGHRGATAGIFEEIFGEEMVTIEKQCKVQGKQFCLEETFPTRLIKKKDLSPMEKRQLPSPVSRYPELRQLEQTMHYLR